MPKHQRATRACIVHFIPKRLLTRAVLVRLDSGLCQFVPSSDSPRGAGGMGPDTQPPHLHSCTPQPQCTLAITCCPSAQHPVVLFILYLILPSSVINSKCCDPPCEIFLLVILLLISAQADEPGNLDKRH